MFCGLFSNLDVSTGSTADSIMQSVGKGLIEVSSQSVGDFRADLRECKFRAMRQEVLALEARLDGDLSLAPSCSQDIQNYIRLLKFGQNQPTAGIPAELLYNRDIERATSWAQRIVSLYGQLLCVWPDITRAALNCREECF
jgi:hypothetical protein